MTFISPHPKCELHSNKTTVMKFSHLQYSTALTEQGHKTTRLVNL